MLIYFHKDSHDTFSPLPSHSVWLYSTELWISPPASLCCMKDETGLTLVPAVWLFWLLVSSSLSGFSLFCVSLSLWRSRSPTPCHCTVLWFWITSVYIVMYPEVYHYGSSLSVGKLTCCGTWLQFPTSATKSLKSPACLYHTPPSLWVCLATRKYHPSHHRDYMELICLWFQNH